MDTHQTTSLLVGLAVIVLLARLLGALARRCGQPAVVGEVLAGVALGPTLLDGAVSDALFPDTVRPLLSALAAVGVAVFMFIVGLEIDAALLRGNGRLAVTVSLSSILVPCGLGMLLALYLAGDYSTGDERGLVLFMGVAMAITAFPVLARILTDRQMTRTPLGAVALACAAIGDVLAWVLLAAVVAISSPGGADQWRMLLAVPYLLVMFFVLRPLLRRLAARRSELRLTPTVFACILAGLLLSAAATEWVGLHYIFGAFLFGAILPRTGTEQLHAEVHNRLGQMTGTLLLPVFFLVSGLKVDLSEMDTGGLGALALIMLVAVGGKSAGAIAAARLHRMPLRQSAALATLLNTRGLTELIVLNVGLQLGFIGQDLYSLMVVMAVITTAMTGPLLSWILGRPREDDLPPAAGASGRKPGTVGTPA
ncbi:cation:proton antiporter domain-containing protein [Streptomyces phytophilus]|uniref:cation:proton antiporter domain-containing protein n=1 Tax=Streptomyces phytophilus TaxID=722715 RepID=UPI0015F0F53E|nr:cation:proton antiporter [Streptomyces phytophilus]